MEITEQVALAPYTTLGVGGSARYFVAAGSREEVAAAYAAARARTGASPIILGDGTNVLFADGELPRLVLRVALLGKTVVEETDDAVLLRVGAGEDWDELVAYTTEAGWAGLENLSGIPGTVGAAPVQNINAYGVSVAEIINF
jgi:UDP-N-acetylmuramate dehydrogenase